MEREEISKGYVYCSHCENVVSRSTFKRHERKRDSLDAKTDDATSSRNNECEYTTALAIKLLCNYKKCVWVHSHSNEPCFITSISIQLSLKNPLLFRNYLGTI